jgi:hypothetical protein
MLTCLGDLFNEKIYLRIKKYLNYFNLNGISQGLRVYRQFPLLNVGNHL